MDNRKIIPRLLLALLLSLLLPLALPVPPALAQAVTLSPTSGAAGVVVSVSGTGFTPSASYQIIFAYGSTYQVTVRTGTVTGAGAINDSFTVPFVPGGIYTVRVQTSTNSVNSSFTVNPAISLNTTTFSVGDPVNITGSGYAPTTTATILLDSQTVATTNTSAFGTFTVSFNLPATTAGTHTLTARDLVTNQSASITVVSDITISPTSGAPGTTVTVNGTGFRAGYLIAITYGGFTVGTNPASVVTNSAGSFTATFNVPTQPNGTVQVRASDSVNSASATFTMIAVIRIDPASGGVGTRVTVTGSGFNASNQVNVTFDNATVARVVSDINGNFSAVFNVPESTAGQHVIRAADNTNSVTGTFTIQPKISLTPNTGRAGTLITVAGSGFNASRQTSIYFDSSLMVTVNTNDTGNFTTSFNSPTSSAGQHTVLANDGISSASAPYNALPDLSLSPTSAQMGAQVTIRGTGFAASRTVSIRFGNAVVKTTPTDANGSFSDRFTVPALDAGSYNVTASDGVNTAVTTFTITISFSINPTTGNVGSTVTVTGMGFSGMVTVKYDGTVVLTTVAAADGSFTGSFVVPVSVHGDHIVAASDATTSLQTIFTMESVPPPTPTLLTPTLDQRQGPRPTFTWEAVSDPSNVTYSLQIAIDEAMTQTVLQKDGLTVPVYTLSLSESLASRSKDAPYFWRVRAIDLASNEGNWTAPSSFYVTLFPDWAKYGLIGLGGLLVILVMFWLGLAIGRGRRSE